MVRQRLCTAWGLQILTAKSGAGEDARGLQSSLKAKAMLIFFPGSPEAPRERRG